MAVRAFLLLLLVGWALEAATGTLGVPEVLGAATAFSPAFVPLCSQPTPLRKKSQRAFVMAARAIQPSLRAGSDPVSWPHGPAPPGARPALGLPWACSKEPCRPAMPLGPGLPRALSATPGLPAPERAR